MTAKTTLTGASSACKGPLSWQELPWQKINRQVFQLQLRIAKAEREGLGSQEYRDRLTEVQLKPPSAEARVAQPKYYGAAVAQPSAASSAPAPAVEKTKKVRKEKTDATATASAAASVVLTAEPVATTTTTDKPKKVKKAAVTESS